ncbi:type III secretion system chaperone [Pantoea sp. 18069]|uniref:type III secretion system chaperone n=1 Tax=Pantoea sp. 18069 TaxID=2681415 RepID=UPI00135BE965|nr:type III secretion system chaperone [Pantoea sp. 18069]
MTLAYSGLLTQLAQHIGIDAGSLLAQQVLRIGELDVFLQQGGTPEAPEVLLCSVLGRPCAQRFAEVLRTLMQANHRGMGTAGGTLGLSPAGDAISWSQRRAARDLDGAMLAAGIAGFAALGQAWMQYVIADPGEAAQVSAHVLDAGMRA